MFNKKWYQNMTRRTNSATMAEFRTIEVVRSCYKPTQAK